MTTVQHAIAEMNDSEEHPFMVSVIIVTRNEESHIKECVESILESLAPYRGEVVLVDSSSEDKTVEVAAHFPVKILQLRRDWVHSASAGFHVGFKNCRGDYVCFIGGDMKLNPRWLPEALAVLRNEAVAGVSGLVLNKFDENGGSEIIRRRISFGFDNMTLGDVDVLGGPAMFRRTVLEKVGSYHPFLKAGEEAELSSRIRSLGYRLIRLEVEMVEHHDSCPSLKSYLRKYQWMYPLEVGRSIRYSAHTGWQGFRARLRPLIGAALLLLFLAYTVVAGSLFLLGIASGFLAASVAVYAIICVMAFFKRRSVTDGLLSMAIIHLRAIAVVLGFLKGLPNPRDYPSDPIEIK